MNGHEVHVLAKRERGACQILGATFEDTGPGEMTLVMMDNSYRTTTAGTGVER
jgi:hypothetical protein